MEGPFNREIVAELKDDREMFENFARLLMDDMGKGITSMEMAIQEGNQEELKRISHAVKGMGGYVLGNVKELARELEKTCNKEPQEKLLEKVALLRKEYESIRGKIEKYLEKVHG